MLRISETPSQAARALDDCRAASETWARTALSTRLAIVRRARHLMAEQAVSLAATVALRLIRDTLVCEVLPLLDAMRFLERRAPSLLATQKLRGGRPLWLFGVSAEIYREPLGVVLIIGPGNYPLFLPCAQAIQALVAGNAVCLKPAPGGEAAAAAVATYFHEAGLPSDVLRLLETSSGPEAVACRFDHIVLTGSADTGVRVLQAAAPHLTPTTMELSGCDAAYVLPGADLQRVAQCLAYGLTLNGGATCLAPRRVFVSTTQALALETLLLPLLEKIPPAQIAERIARQMSTLLEQAAKSGARIITSGPGRPVVVADARCTMQLLQHDLFAPWLALVPVEDMDAALEQSDECRYALGASIFGPLQTARAFARRVNAGSICINDVIVPTADPRLPFGGNKRSGFGRTRGAEGLLEMTTAKSVSARRGRWMPHLASTTLKDQQRFAQLIRWLHGGWRTR